jgi:hypothetical protein
MKLNLVGIGILAFAVAMASGCSAIKGVTAVATTKTKCLLNPLKECDKCECCTATNDLCCCRHADKCRCDPTTKDGKCCVVVTINGRMPR